MARTRFALFAAAGIFATCSAENRTQRLLEEVKDAEAAYASDLKDAEDLAADMKSYIDSLPSNASKAAAAIADRVTEDFSKAKKRAQEAFEDRIGALEDASESNESVANLTKSAMHAADDVEEVGYEIAKAMKRSFREARKESKEHAQRKGHQASAAAHGAYKAARALERAQRKSGASERVYEGEFFHTEHVTEHLEDRAEDLREDAEHAVERFFDKVEHLVEERAHTARKEAKARAKALERKVREAEKEAEKEDDEKKDGEKKDDKKKDDEKADEKKADEKKASEKKDDDKKDDDKKDADKKDADKKDDAGPKAGADDAAVALAAGVSASDFSGAALVGLLALAGTVSAYAARARKLRSIREAPLLG